MESKFIKINILFITFQQTLQNSESKNSFNVLFLYFPLTKKGQFNWFFLWCYPRNSIPKSLRKITSHTSSKKYCYMMVLGQSCRTWISIAPIMVKQLHYKKLLWTFWMKPLLQYLQRWGLSPVWIFECFLRVDAVVKAEPQWKQIWFLGRSLGRSPCTVFMW